MKSLIFIFTLLFSINAYALKDCSPLSLWEEWNNCEGTLTFPDGEAFRGYFIKGDYVLFICSNMGLLKGTEAFGDCALKLIDKIN